MDTITERRRLELRLLYLQFQRDQLELQIATAYEALQAADGDAETRPTPDTIRPFGGVLATVWPSRRRLHVNAAAPRPDNSSD
jgi:hypothetical protein